MDTNFYKQLHNLSLKYRVQFNPDNQMETIVDYIESIGQCNDFYPQKVLKMIERIDSVLPRVFYNANNPNNGGRIWTIDIGRDGSEVIYLTVDLRTCGDDRIDPSKVPETIAQIEAIARGAHADEISHEMDEEEEYRRYKQVEFRFWWD